MSNQICAHYVTDKHPLLHCGLKLTRGTQKEDSICISSAASFMTEPPITAANPVMK
jgi:hypothetical protein